MLDLEVLCSYNLPLMTGWPNSIGWLEAEGEPWWNSAVWECHLPRGLRRNQPGWRPHQRPQHLPCGELYIVISTLVVLYLSHSDVMVTYLWSIFRTSRNLEVQRRSQSKYNFCHAHTHTHLILSSFFYRSPINWVLLTATTNNWSLQQILTTTVDIYL